MIIQDVTEIEKFIASLDPENRANMTANINFLVMTYLSKQKNLNIYSFMDRFITLLSPENQELLDIYVEDLVKEFNQMHLEETFESNESQDIEEDVSISFKDSKSDSDEPQVVSTNNIVSPQDNKIANDANQTLEEEKTNEKTDKEKVFDFVSIQEFLNGITSFITDKAKEDVGNLVIDPQTYSVLRNFNGENSVSSIYLKNYVEKPFEDYLIDVLIPFHVKGYISFNKNDYFLNNANKLKLGEILISFYIVDVNKLDLLLKKQKEVTTPKKKSKSLSSTMYDITELEMVQKPSPTTKKLIGEMFIESEGLSKEIIDKFLVIQKWYNHIVSSDL